MTDFLNLPNVQTTAVEELSDRYIVQAKAIGPAASRADGFIGTPCQTANAQARRRRLRSQAKDVRSRPSRHLGARYLTRARFCRAGAVLYQGRNPGVPMPIRPEHRGFYPIDWPQLSGEIRFVRAKGLCEQCGRPHGRIVLHLGDGCWWDDEAQRWRDGRGRRLRRLPSAVAVLAAVRSTRVYLATAHRNHDTADNAPENLAAWCQRCHILHDAPEHARRRRITFLRTRASGDLFLGPYPG